MFNRSRIYNECNHKPRQCRTVKVSSQVLGQSASAWFNHHQTLAADQQLATLLSPRDDNTSHKVHTEALREEDEDEEADRKGKKQRDRSSLLRSLHRDKDSQVSRNDGVGVKQWSVPSESSDPSSL